MVEHKPSSEVLASEETDAGKIEQAYRERHFLTMQAYLDALINSSNDDGFVKVRYNELDFITQASLAFEKLSKKLNTLRGFNQGNLNRIFTNPQSNQNKIENASFYFYLRQLREAGCVEFYHDPKKAMTNEKRALRPTQIKILKTKVDYESSN